MKPSEDVRRLLKTQARRNSGTIDEDHAQAQAPRGIKLGPCADAARIFRDDDFDAMHLQQGEIFFEGEGSARQDDIRRKGQIARRIDEAQKVIVLGLCSESFKLQPTDGEKDAGLGFWQGLDGSLHRRHQIPAIARLGRPRLTFECHQRHSLCRASHNGMGRHLGGEGMCRVDHMGDAFLTQVGTQAFDAAKAANADRQGLAHRRICSTGIGKDGGKLLFRQGFRHEARFGRAAEKKDAHLG